MISIIICSRQKTLNSDLSRNIENTIGCDYELVLVDNSENKFSIHEAYNHGLNRSKGSLICFMHDDILINTSGWGGIIVDLFKQNPQVGLLGIAGGENKTKMPSAWWDVGPNHLKVIQHYNDKPKELWDQGFDAENLVEVAAIDGVFMVMKADDRIRFDERLKGFHNYDLFLSLKNKSLQKKVMVTNEILIEHFSPGSLNRSWYLSTSKFHKLYAHELPLFVHGKISGGRRRIVEFRTAANFINGLLKMKMIKEAFYWWIRLIRLKPFSLYHIKFLRTVIKSF